jgi:hypothetical protein
VCCPFSCLYGSAFCGQLASETRGAAQSLSVWLRMDVHPTHMVFFTIGKDSDLLS